jgi:hypothetical protein
VIQLSVTRSRNETLTDFIFGFSLGLNQWRDKVDGWDSTHHCTHYCKVSLYWLTPWSSLHEKLTVSSVKKSRLLWNPKVHYRVHKSPPSIPNLSQMNPTHTLQNYFNKTHFNIILPSMLRSSEWSLPFSVSSQNFIRIPQLPHARYMPRPFHPPWFDHPRIWWRVQRKKLTIRQALLFATVRS